MLQADFYVSPGNLLDGLYVYHILYIYIYICIYIYFFSWWGGGKGVRIELGWIKKIVVLFVDAAHYIVHA